MATVDFSCSVLPLHLSLLIFTSAPLHGFNLSPYLFRQCFQYIGMLWWKIRVILPIEMKEWRENRKKRRGWEQCRLKPEHSVFNSTTSPHPPIKSFEHHTTHPVRRQELSSRFRKGQSSPQPLYKAQSVSSLLLVSSCWQNLPLYFPDEQLLSRFKFGLIDKKWVTGRHLTWATSMSLKVQWTSSGHFSVYTVP